VIHMVQLKIVANDGVVEKFKKIVLAKHGKLELSIEGEEALRLYIQKYQYLLLEFCPPDMDPLAGIVEIGCSDELRNVLKDLAKLEADEV